MFDKAKTKKAVLGDIMTGAKSGMAKDLKSRHTAAPPMPDPAAPVEPPMDDGGGNVMPDAASAPDVDMSAVPADLSGIDAETLKALLLKLLSQSPEAPKVPQKLPIP